MEDKNKLDNRINDEEKELIKEPSFDEEKSTELSIDEKFEQDKSFKKKLIIFLGTAIFIVSLISVLYYFFVYRVNLQINISTDKQIEYIERGSEKEQITTQKFISDLNYSMRYDVTKFSVFKYQGQDVYRGLENEDVLVVVEKSKVPNNCLEGTNSPNTSYNSCNILLDIETEEYYVYNNDYSYKIMIKKPTSLSTDMTYDLRINEMLKSFHIS